MAKHNKNVLPLLALIFSVVALGLSLNNLNNAGGGGQLSDEEFSAKVDKGIQAFVKKQQEAAQPGDPTDTGDPVDVSADDDAIKGDKNAPVTIVEFSDYECPFCARFYTGAYQQLVSDYIDTGKVRLVFRDFPLSFHRNAKPAAMAAECAGDLGGSESYYEFHNKIFENQSSGLGAENLKKWADEIGLNAGKFADCLDSEKFSEEVDKDFADGQAVGVSGTPAFFINGRKISGAQPFSVFQAIIEEGLNK